MQKYAVTIKQTTTSEFNIEARSREEAEDIAVKIAQKQHPETKWHYTRRRHANAVAHSGK